MVDVEVTEKRRRNSGLVVVAQPRLVRLGFLGIGIVLLNELILDLKPIRSSKSKSPPLLEVENIDGMVKIRSEFRNQSVLHVVGDILMLEPCLGDQLRSARISANNRIARWGVPAKTTGNRNAMLCAICLDPLFH